MTQRTVYQDLLRQMVNETEEYLNRRINQAAAVLEPAELVMLMYTLGTNVILGAQTLVVTMGSGEANPAPPLDEMEAGVVRKLRAARPAVLAAGAAIKRGEKPERAL